MLREIDSMTSRVLYVLSIVLIGILLFAYLDISSCPSYIMS